MGRHAQLRDRFLGPEDAIASGVVHHDIVAHQLEQILVRAHDHHTQPRGARLAYGRRDHVIRLQAVLLQHRDSVGLDNFPNPAHLLLEIFGRWGPVGLVCIVQLMPKRTCAGIHGDRQQRRGLLLDQFLQHRRHAQDRVCGLAGWARERR